MLYKKYHRNYVSQFKKGVKVKFMYNDMIYEVVKEPYYSNDNHRIEFRSSSYFCIWLLIYPSGFINYDIKIVGENAV